MAKKKPANGKGSNGNKGSRPSHPVSKPISEETQKSATDSAAGEASCNLPPAIDAHTAASVADLAMKTDAPTAATVADLAMEIENSDLEILATEATVPSPTVSDTATAVDNIECSRYKREKAKGKAPIKSLLPIVPQTKAEYRPVGEKRTGTSVSSDAPAKNTAPQPSKKTGNLSRTPPPPQGPSSPPRHVKVMENRQRSLSPTIKRPQRTQSSIRSASVEFTNLREGGLFVDLSPYAAAHQSKDSLSSDHSSGHVSDGSNYSGDEDNPDDGNDKYIEFSFSRGIRDFKECIDSSALFDLPYCGNSFTWSNGHVSKKLDRILTNASWLQEFPESIGVFGVPGISDHSPCCVFLDQSRPKQKRPFKFFAHLNQHEEFVEILRNCWNSFDFHGTNQLRVSKKLKELKGIIKSFNREHYSQLEQRVEAAFSEMCSAQENALTSPGSSSSQAVREAHNRWHVLAKAEDSFLKQKSRVRWSAEGDAGTAYYHRVIKTRQAQNQIVFLLDRDGKIIDQIEDIKKHTVDYYSILLGGPSSSAAPSPSTIASFLPIRCSAEAVDLLAAEFSEPEIQAVLVSSQFLCLLQLQIVVMEMDGD
ncbi:Endonuclease/exonuclease/phosphatase protein [Raphanus sativus]|nr:Endonuclease/exonuclease/phosphatase protein [Raphanus sativus]